MRRALALLALLAPPVVGLVLQSTAGAQQRVAQENSKVTAARFNAQLAVAYLEQNDVAAAREKIDKALAQNPKDAGVQTTAGLVYERLQEVDEADRHYATAVRLEPRNPGLQNNYAVFQCRRGRFEQGQKLFEQAARNPAYATPEVAFSNAGVCARSAGNLAAAEALFRKALAVRPEYPDALLQMADLTFTRGAGAAARAYLQRYFTASPSAPDALLLAVKVERALGDAEASNRYAAQLQKQFPGSEQALQLRGGRGSE
jgi:type IV pilus assembly protein PilF